MSTSTTDIHADLSGGYAPGAGAGAGAGAGVGLLTRARAYFASDSTRTIQTILGLIWLLDGGLQFQSFMYSHEFVAMLEGLTPGQPGWIAASVNWGARTAAHNLTVYNTLFALVQVFIGVGLLWRRTVKPALAISFVWALCVWWFGEAFGMMFMTMASPLTGAPGAVLLYALIGAIVWPGALGTPGASGELGASVAPGASGASGARPGGLLGVRGARIAWCALWLVMAWLWLETPSSSSGAVSGAIKAAPSGMSWLSTLQEWAAKGAAGNGLPIALVLAGASAVIGVGVAANWRAKPLLALAIGLNLVYWVLGQGFGGIAEGGATDPNAGLLFIVLALALASLVSFDADGSPATTARFDPHFAGELT